MKLKTLKDLVEERGEKYKYHIVFLDELKTEAIKWVKDMQIKKHYMCADYFKHFFNITEEELK